MTEQGKASNGHSGLVGYALDGFGIYGDKGAGGKHLSNADLDECHGHVETVIWDGKPQRIYHYHLTDEYPYTLGCFKGTPAATARQQAQPGQGLNAALDRPQAGGNGTARPQGGPPGGEGLLQAAAAELGVSVDALRRAIGRPPPDFDRAARQLGISAERIRAAFDRARRASN